MIIDRLSDALGTALGFVLLSLAYAHNWQRLHRTAVTSDITSSSRN